MKRVRTIIASFPYDCWCQTILHLESSKDFFNLICSVNGLLQYIEKINPKCTRNVKFHMVKIPYSKKQFVSNLKCNMSKLMNKRTIIGCPSSEIFFRRISTQFANIDRLCISCSSGCEVLDDIHLKTSFPSLRKLDLTLFETKNLKFTSELLELTDLKIWRKCGDDVKFLSIILDPDPNLSIDFNSLPKLRNLQMRGWSLSVNHNHMGHMSFETLRLGCTRLIEKSIDETFEIQTLFLSEDSVSFFESIHRVKNLKKLVLNCFGEDFGNDFRDCSLSIKEISDLPQLELLEIEGSGNIYNTESSILLKKLPKLNQVCVRYINLRVLLSNTPSVERLEFYAVNKKVMFQNRCDTTNLKVISITSSEGVLLGENLLLNIQQNKYLDSLEILKFQYSGELSFIGFPNLRVINGQDEIEIREISDCPRLEVIEDVKISESFSISDVECLKKLEFSSKFSAMYQFFETLRELEIKKLECYLPGLGNFGDLHLYPENISRIHSLRLTNLNEFILRGKNDHRLSLKTIIIIRSKLVEIENVFSLGECILNNIKTVRIKNCSHLKSLRIMNRTWGSNKFEESKIDLVELEKLPSIHLIKIKCHFSIIKEMKMKSLPPTKKSTFVQNVAEAQSEDDEERGEEQKEERTIKVTKVVLEF